MSDFYASLSILTKNGVALYILRGVLFSLVVALIAVLVGLLLGSVLAICRNYCNRGLSKIAKWISIAYIEVFRNTPLLLWMFVGVVFFPAPDFSAMFTLTSVEVKLLWKAGIALVLFTSSVIAEIVRGGLNSVNQGQFEAAHSQGFNIVQTMVLIVLPQAYRNIIPTLLSQVITTIKDSSYLANVATIELMSRTKQLMSSAGRYNGTGVINVTDVFVLYGLAALIYFVINFTLSCIVRAMQKRRSRPQVVRVVEG